MFNDNNNNNGSINNSNNNTTIKTIKNNIESCMKIFNNLKSTLGPYGRDKLIIDRNNNYLTTNDGATVLKYLKINEPAARLLIGIAESQDETVGDGTTSVVLLTCCLLQNALKYLQLSIHPIKFIQGYQISLDFCLQVINEIKLSPIGNDNDGDINTFQNEFFIKHLNSIASTSISSKILSRYNDHFSNIGVEAIKKLKFNPTQDLIRVIGITGNSMLDSTIIDGILLEINNNQLLNFNLNSKSISNNNNNNNNEKILNILNNPSIIIGKLQLNNNDNSDNNVNFDQKTNIELTNKIQYIISNKINIVISDTDIPIWVESIFKENGILYFIIQDSRELEILSHCLNSPLVYDFGKLQQKNNDGNDKDKSISTKPKSIKIQSIGDKLFLIISTGIIESGGATVVIRSPTDTMLQECIRSFKDMLNILSATVRNPYFIGGGGCTYIELSKRLREKAKSVFSKKDEKLLISINCFADSLEMIPMILIQNAGYDSIELIEKLKSIHQDNNNNKWKGINLNNGKIVDMVSELKVFEPSFLLSNILTLSSRASQMILRINNNILIDPRSEFKKIN